MEVIQFITIDQKSGEMAVTPEAMGFLASLPSEIKIATLSVIGPINSGKSFLCNTFTQGSFTVAGQIQNTATTCGIQMVLVEITKTFSVLVMDCQGLQVPAQTGSVSSLRSPRNSSTASLRSPRGTSNLGQKSTDKLIQLSALLSSCTIFNQQGALSDRLLDYLEPISRLHDLIKTPEILSDHFVCVIRDHMQLELQKSSTYTPTSPSALLETCLNQASSIAIKKQKVQESLRTCFKSRECFTLPKPHKLKADDSFTQSSSDQQDFESEASTIFKQLKLKPKQVQNKFVNGNMLLGLALDYIQTLQQVKPDFQQLVQAIDRVSLEETERQQEIAYSNFEQYLTTYKTEMPNKNLKTIFQSFLQKHKSQLRLNLAEFCTFKEITSECQTFQKRAHQLLQRYLDDNYSISFQLSCQVLTKLCSNQQQLTLRDKWTQILQDFEYCDTENQSQVFAESILKGFVDYTRVAQREVVQQLGEENEDNDLQEKPQHEMPHNLLDQLCVQVESQQNTLQESLSDLQGQTQNQHKLRSIYDQQKVGFEQEMSLTAQELQQISQQKNDYTLQIESIQREINQQEQLIIEIQRVKQMQQDRQVSEWGKVLEEVNESIQKSHLKVDIISLQQNEIDIEIGKESAQYQVEQSKYEAEIKQLKHNISEIEQKLQTPTKSIMFKTTSEFLQSEIYNKYLTPLQQSLQQSQSSKDLKLQLFEKHRQLNQQKMELTTQEADHKTLNFQALSDYNQSLIAESGVQSKYQDSVKQSQQALQVKLEMELKLTDSMMEFVTQKESNFNLIEELDTEDLKCEKSLQQIVQTQSDTKMKDAQMQQLEEDAYELTITNQAKVMVKERLVEVLPEMVTYFQSKKGGGSDGLGRAVRQIDDDMCRSKLAKILKKYKLQ